MFFEWDESKSEWTLANRGFDFTYAVAAFTDPNHFIVTTKAGRDGEARWMLTGKAYGTVLTLVYTWRKSQNAEEVCRIISARAASKKERRRYQAVR